MGEKVEGGESEDILSRAGRDFGLAGFAASPEGAPPPPSVRWETRVTSHWADFCATVGQGTMYVKWWNGSHGLEVALTYMDNIYGVGVDRNSCCD